MLAEDRPYGPGNPDYEHDGRMAELDSIATVRFSHLKAYGRSAAHGQHARQQEKKQTTAMQLGTAVHAMLFDTRKVCGYPGAQRRGKEYEAFSAEHPDYEILTMSEYDKARSMVDAVAKCVAARPYLNGAIEQTINFRWMGVDCRATPDVRGTDYLTELKTSNTSDPMRFPWQARRMCYHAQMRMQQLATFKRPDCFIVCIESEEPFPVTVFQMDTKALDIGERLLMLWMERLKNSELSGHFPAYSQSVCPLIIDDEQELEIADAD